MYGTFCSDGHHTVTPYLVVKGAAQLIEFMKQAFAAEEIQRMAQPDGSIMHAEVKIGDSMVMMGEASEQHPPIPAMLHRYVTDADAVYRRALAAGATSVREKVSFRINSRSIIKPGRS